MPQIRHQRLISSDGWILPTCPMILNAYSCKHHHLYPPPTLWTQYEHGWDLSLVRLYQSNNKISHGQPKLEIHPHLIVENFLEKLSTKPLVQMLMPSYIIQHAKYPLGNGFHPFFKKVTYPFSTLFITHTFFFFFSTFSFLWWNMLPSTMWP